jgi:hypothetical protein
MRIIFRLMLACGFTVMSLPADSLNPAVKPVSAAKQETASRPRVKRLKWLRRLGGAEVGLAMKLSAAGIPQRSTPAPTAAAW